MTAHEGLPEGLNATFMWNRFRHEHVLDDHDGEDCEDLGCTQFEVVPSGTRSRISALEARCGELEAMQPREWTAETIKDAPEGYYRCKYFGRGVFEDNNRPLWDIDESIKHAETRKAKGLGAVVGLPIAYFGPIPQPSSNSRKEGEG